MRMLIVILVLIGLTAGVGGWYWHVSSKTHTEYRTQKVERGDLLSTISATGTVEPEEVVDVGAQVAGLILSFGTDSNGKPIDYRSPIEKDTVLANIDPAVYKADLDTAQAQLGQANANVKKAQADVEQMRAKLFQAQQNWLRAQKVGPSDALSQNDYDMYRAEYETGKANEAVAQAEVLQAQTGIDQAKAALDKARRNFEFCTIKSPVKGVIIDRRVNVGQTVVSSLNAPSLFLIAKDLTRMQVWVAVNEADIGHIQPGQNVTFTCDAFPGKKFTGTVGKVRLNATMTQNVVTYTVEVVTENPKSVLLPYLTANVQFEVEKDPNVLLVPNAALRWYPSSVDQVAADARADFKPIDEDPAGAGGGGGGGRPQGAERQGGGDQSATKDSGKQSGRANRKVVRHGTLWVRDGEFVRPVAVTIGATDGLNTAVYSDKLSETQEVVVGEIVDSPTNTGERNPFIPQMGRGGRGGGRGR
jgi:HlyD family secretion protein